jgi:Phenazine biosynthesis-like protein
LATLACFTESGLVLGWRDLPRETIVAGYRLGYGNRSRPLAAYLASEGQLKNNELAIEQGTKMGRRSILRVRLTPEPELSGTGVVVLRGLIRI